METLKACMILVSSGRMDSKTIRQALVAFTLMERYLIHFEDNYRQVFQQAQKQMLRDMGGSDTGDKAAMSSTAASKLGATT